MKKSFKEEESTEIPVLKTLDLINNIYHTKWVYNCFKEKSLAEENINPEFTLKNIDETRNDFIEAINWN